MTTDELKTFGDSLNSDDLIDATFFFQLVDTAKSIIYDMRPWVALRKVDTSKTVQASPNAWLTAIDLSTITGFTGKFYGEYPITLFDDNTRREQYGLVPFEQRVMLKDTPNVAAYDASTKYLYLLGSVPFAGTLYLSHINYGSEITTASTPIWPFPNEKLLAYYAISISKGAVDFDDINERMAPSQRALANALLGALERWDNALQLQTIETFDQSTSMDSMPRAGAINFTR